MPHDFESLLDRALSLPPAARHEFIERAGLDEAARRRLLKLLSLAEAPGFLDAPALRAAHAVADVPSSYASGRCIGAYRLERRLGTGGMGEVWLAKRSSGDFEQTVALKLMLPGPQAMLDRFRAERQILARLDHPGIARLFDGGVTEEGWPWMAMEYVEGDDLLHWCERRSAGLAQRLDLFLQSCDAAAYAHAHLVVHRDIKPSNIFVTAQGRARLLDFGIAKALVGELPADVTQTTHLSPAYAAPEQLAGGSITTATDVFSLGVTLYQLLAGRLPWPIERAPLGAALMRVAGAMAPVPPSRVGQGPIPAQALRGDLDAIVLKALRHDPADRYPDARALGEDVRRHLRREPVLARSGARVYVARRLLRRHWVSIAAAATVLLALIAGLIGVGWQAQRAEREAARANAVKEFLIDVFRASDPRIASDTPRGSITARELLDASVAQIDAKFANDPQTHIELLGTVADLFRELEDDSRYDSLRRRHLTRATQYYGELHPIVLAARLQEAILVKDRLEHAEALRQLEVIDPLISKAGLDRSDLRAQWWLARGQALMPDSTKTAQQIDALERAANLFAEVAPAHPVRVTALADLGTAHSNFMNYAAARRYLELSIALSEQVEVRNDAELATINGNLGLIAQSQGDFVAAEQAYARAEDIIRRTYGESHHRHWVPAAIRARTAHLGGDREKAHALFARLFGEIPADATHHDAMEAREWFGSCLAAEGRPAEAVPLLEASERFYRDTRMYDFQLARVRATLGDAYDRAGRHDDARRMLQAALEQRVALRPPDFQPVLAIRERYGRFLLQQGDVAGAQEQFEEVLRNARNRRLSHIALAHAGLAQVALARDDVVAALTASERAVDLYENVTGFRDVRMGPSIWLVHAQVLMRAGDAAAAHRWAQAALEARERYDHPSSSAIAEAADCVREIARVQSLSSAS